MLSKLTGLLSKNLFFVSHQKTLLRRRKQVSKKQKVAKKKFLEHNPNGSYTNELRILQIQKELDKKVSKNQHLNELMDELFYPDVRYANQKIMQQNLLKISINPEQNIKKQNPKIGQNGEIDDEQNEEFDELAEQIYLCQIPSQFFELYLKNSQFFTQQYLVTFLQKLDFYFKNKQSIQQRVTEKWKESLYKLKLTDVQMKKRKRCPYIFIEQDELIRDEDWNKIVKDINKKIALSAKHIANQSNGENEAAEELESLDESFYSLENNCDLAIQIKIAANYLPEEIFDSIVDKAFAILKMEQADEGGQEKLPIFSHSEKVKLLGVLALKSATKSKLTKSLHIDLPEASQKHEEKIIQLAKNLCQDILNSNDCTADDLGTVFLSDKSHYKFLDYQLLELAKPKILKFLSRTTLERSIDYIRAFWQDGKTADSDFIQVLIFDIYRKLSNSVSKGHLFDFISHIKGSRLTFSQSQIEVRTSDIYPKIAETVSKYLNSNVLTHEEIKTLMTSIYDNYPFYKVQSRGNILQMVATSIVKMGQGFKLEELTQMYFRATVMGHRSKIFSKYLFQRYQKEYKNLMKTYKSQKVQLIVDKNKKDEQNEDNQTDAPDLPSMNEILLEENLLMMFWCFVINLNSQNASLPLNDMIEMFPLYLHSSDPMIQDLKDDLNNHLKEYNFFPEIKNKTFQTKSKSKKQKSNTKKFSLIATNTHKSYAHNYSESMATEIVEKLKEGREVTKDDVFEDLVFYLMRYSLKHQSNTSNFRLPERWNESVRNVFDHRAQDFQTVKSEFIKMQNNKDSDSDKSIGSRIMELLKKKQQKDSNRFLRVKESVSAQKPYKLYQLL